MSDDQERDPPRFPYVKLNNMSLENEQLKAEVTRLTAELEKATAVAVMYRDQIKVYQQHSGGPMWSGQREGAK